MILRHRAALNGGQLDEVDSRIMIKRISTGEGKMNISTVSLPADGMRVTGIDRDSIDITITFNIRLRKRDMAERETVMEKVNAWAAAGGILTVGHKEGRLIHVFLAQAASIGDPWEWTKDYSLVFRACGVPYWQQESPVTVIRQSTSGETITMMVDGSAESVVEAQFRNQSGGTISAFSIQAGDSQMVFSGLGLGNGETLVIDHEDNGKKNILRLRIQGTGGTYRSVMDKRTGSDDLYVEPGTNRITVSAGGTGRLTVSCAGRFA